MVNVMWDFWRNWRKPAAEKQLELLNAYLDDALTPRQREALEARLGQDEALRAELAQLRQVREGLRQLPRRPAPRNFTLDPALYGRPQRQPLVQAYPVLRAATLLTAFFFVLALALQAISPPRAMLFTAAESAAAPAAQVAIEAAPLAAEVETAEVTRVVTETVLEAAPRAGAANEMPAAASVAESAADAAAPASTAPADAAEEGSAPFATPDMPRLAQETETARAVEGAGEKEEGETAVIPTPVPETAIPT
ncbi:anti-sigma factor family protein, partial [Thermoleptolyngbya sp.]